MLRIFNLLVSNRDINLSARRLLLLSEIGPSIEHGGKYGKVIRVRYML